LARHAYVEVLDEGVERIGHMAVAQIPGIQAAMIHRPIVFLGVLDHLRVLLGVEILILSQQAVAASVV
jgi:hypothetical protein